MLKQSLLGTLPILLLPLAPMNAPAESGESVLAYYEDDGGASSSALRSRTGYFNQLAVDAYSVSSKGVVSGTAFSDDMNFARSKKIMTFAAISNFAGSDFSAAMAHSIITSSAYTQNFMTGMIGKLAEGHYRGINIDFEAVPAADRPAYTAFIGTVAQKMHADGYLVIVSVPAELKDDPASPWTGAFDLKALGAIVDILQLMTYDENGTWSSPGPVAGLDWVRKSVSYVVSVVPSTKISLGIPAFGYDWDLTESDQNTQIAWASLAPLLAKTKAKDHWDAASSSPYFNYTLNGHNHVVWHENVRSLGLKSRLAATCHLAGISVYALGMEDAAFWQAVISSP